MSRLAVFLLFAGALHQPATAQVIGQRSDSTCLDLRQEKITATGLLKVKSFAGPPNYESVERGDREERAYMLELPDIDCVDENPGETNGTSDIFIEVHVSSYGDALLEELQALVGHRITIEGTAFNAQTAHHRAPVVLMATKVSSAGH